MPHTHTCILTSVHFPQNPYIWRNEMHLFLSHSLTDPVELLVAQQCEFSVTLAKWQPSSFRLQLCAVGLISVCSSLQCLTASLKAAASPLPFKLHRLSNDIDSQSLSCRANDSNSYWLCFLYKENSIHSNFIQCVCVFLFYFKSDTKRLLKKKDPKGSGQ